MNTYQEYIRWRKTDDFKRWRKRQFLKQGGLCWYCQEFLPKTKQNVEHKTAISLGGKNNKGNLVLACSECNKTKGAKPLTKQERAKYNKQNKGLKGTYLKNKQHDERLYGQYTDEAFAEMCKNL